MKIEFEANMVDWQPCTPFCWKSNDGFAIIKRGEEFVLLYPGNYEFGVFKSLYMAEKAHALHCGFQDLLKNDLGMTVSH